MLSAVAGKNIWFGISAGAAAAFVGYCVYFDHKRRSCPDFKKKLIAKRAAKRREETEAAMRDLPDIKDQQAMQAFFLQEVSHGEAALGEGNINKSAQHFANAVAVCHQPQSLLMVLRESLPPAVFSLMMQKAEVVKQRLAASAFAAALQEDSLE